MFFKVFWENSYDTYDYDTYDTTFAFGLSELENKNFFSRVVFYVINRDQKISTEQQRQAR